MAGPITIKKYANRRLYNMATSAYVTLEDVANMVREGQDFTVTDARTGEDITRQVLTQIIVEAEGAGGALLPVPFLREVIRAYGAGVQTMLPSWLELSMKGFVEGRDGWARTLAAGSGTSAAGELAALMQRSVQQNMELMASGLRAFGAMGLVPRPLAPPPPPAAAASSGEGPAAEIAELKAQLRAMQATLDRLAR